jgi:hypothetical protein
VKTFAAWLEEALQSKPTGPATPVSSLSEQPTLEAFERLLSALPEVAPSRVAQAPWAEALGVELPCDVDTIRRAFRRLAFRTHPDRVGGSHEAFLQAKELLEEALGWLEKTSSQRPSARSPYSRPASVSWGGTCALYA